MENFFDISQFDSYKEDNRREVKRANGGLPNDMWETYSAYANTYGGVIILGVKELDDKHWRTTGLKLKDKDKLLANCLINTDYYGVRGVVIKKEPDKLILENPGYIRTGKEQMRKGGESDTRNKALMKMFNLINIGERAGSGVPNIFNVWEDEGWVDPVIQEKFDPDRTILTLEFKKKRSDKKVTKKTQERYEKILGFMEFGKEYNIQDFCQLLDLKESRTKEILAQMSDYIETVGGNKNRRYVRKNK